MWPEMKKRGQTLLIIAPQATMETQNPREALTEVTAPVIAMMNAQTYSRAIALNMGAEYLGIGVCSI